jgi:predicted DNA binding CopG/RHH family protein
MTSDQLNKEEQGILEAYDAGEFSSEMSPGRKQFLEQAAAATIERETEIQIRMSERDLSTLQRKALEAGIPYRIFVAGILHKYASGSLYDATANKANPADARTSRG